jgi:hypothetical protein
VASAIALVVDPQASLYNVRLLPLWFISVYLMAAWAFGALCIAVAEWWRQTGSRAWNTGSRAVPGDDEGAESTVDGDGAPATVWRPPPPRWGPAAVSGAVVGLLAVMAAVVPPFIVSAASLPVTLGANQVTNWSGLNYAGYEGQPAYPEYRAVIETMQSVAKKYGCGRAMWEYSESENRFGTPESLMLLPYWTSGCVNTMEGLLFESSTTTPYHFINQAEMSAGPSEPEVGLPYGPVDVALGVQHLQLLGVKYFMAETPTVEEQADADPALKLVATTGPWASGYGGTLTHTTWKMYLVRNAPLVTPLRNAPVVLDGVKPAPSSWLTPSLNWYAHPERWNVELAQSGPSSWPHTSVARVRPPVRPVPTTRVSAIQQTDSTVSFHVSRVGTPVLVKVSYFPNWHASGADGPWRVTPNLMVVVPTSHEVTLSYGRSAADDLGQLLSLLGLVVLVVLFVVPAVRRWWSVSRSETNGTETV